MAWKSEIPVSKQIKEKLRLEIINGKIPLGSQFPTVRQLANETSANPNTVQKALIMLEDEGLLETRGTIGRFVTSNEKVLQETRISLQKEWVKRTIDEAVQLGITKDALIGYLKDEEESI